MPRDRESEREEALRYCTLGKIEVVKEYFLLILTKGGSGMKPAFRIHILINKSAGIAFTLFVFCSFCFFVRQNSAMRRENLPHCDTSKQAQRDVHIIQARVFKYNGPASPFRLMKVLSLANFTLNIEADKLI